MSFPMVRISDDQGYWLIRTQSGDYYEEFFLGDFVGIGWDEFSNLEEIARIDSKAMTEKIRIEYPDEKKPGYVCNQIRRFVLEIKDGDIVIIPSESSTHVSFGRIISDVYLEEPKIDEVLDGACPFVKRRQVKWLKTIKRDRLDPYLYKLMFSHNTITDARDYASFIDRTLHSFYIKGDKAHLVLEVTTEEKIFARDLLRLIYGTVDLVDLFSAVTESSINTNDIELKINVQSPGPIELIAGGLAITAIGMILHYVIGGKYSVELTSEKFKLDTETEGLLEKILKFRAIARERPDIQEKIESVEDTINKLKVDMPNELKQYLPQNTVDD